MASLPLPTPPPQERAELVAAGGKPPPPTLGAAAKGMFSSALSVGKKPKGPEQPTVAFLECVPKVGAAQKGGSSEIGAGIAGTQVEAAVEAISPFTIAQLALASNMAPALSHSLPRSPHPQIQSSPDYVHLSQ